jgi:hypothetical protein
MTPDGMPGGRVCVFGSPPSTVRSGTGTGGGAGGTGKAGREAAPPLGAGAGVRGAGCVTLTRGNGAFGVLDRALEAGHAGRLGDRGDPGPGRGAAARSDGPRHSQEGHCGEDASHHSPDRQPDEPALGRRSGTRPALRHPAGVPTPGRRSGTRPAFRHPAGVPSVGRGPSRKVVDGLSQRFPSEEVTLPRRRPDRRRPPAHPTTRPQLTPVDRAVRRRSGRAGSRARGADSRRRARAPR